MSDTTNELPNATNKSLVFTAEDIWSYFEDVGDQKAVCNLCSQVFSYKRTVAHLKLHLQDQHKIHPLSPSQSSLKVEVEEGEIIFQTDDVNDDNLSNQSSSRISNNGDIQLEEYEIDEPVSDDCAVDETKKHEIWKHFEDVGDYKAICYICKHFISFKKRITNLILHLRKKHSILLPNSKNKNTLSSETQVVNKFDNGNNVGLQKAIFYTDVPINDSDDNLLLADNQMTVIELNPQMNNKNAKSGGIWDHFEDIGNYKAMCYYCRQIYSFKTTSTNLKSHLRAKHNLHFEEMKVENSYEKGNSSSVIYRKRIGKKISNVWSHFEKIDKEIATCKLCELQYSYKSSLTNLKKHLETKHNLVVPRIDEAEQTNKSTTKYDYLSEDTNSQTVPAKSETVNDDGDDDDDNDNTLEKLIYESPSPSIDNEDNNIETTHIPVSVSNILNKRKASSTTIPSKRFYSEPNHYEEIEIIQPDSIKKDTKEDEFDVAGKRYAWNLRNMKEKQRLIVEKINADLIYYGRMDKLHENVTISLNTDSTER